MAKAVRKKVTRKKAIKKPLLTEVIEDLTGEPKKVWGEGTPWRTKSEFYVWLRGLLRRGWSKHPLRISKITANRFKAEKHFKNGRIMQVWHCKCEMCGITGPQKEFEVDHITAAGSLRGYDDILGFITRLLYIDDKDLRIVCKKCNSILAYSDKQGVTFEEAKAIKEAISLVGSKQDRKWLEERNVEPESTIAKRREQIIKILMTGG